jgi:hypothetical protein
LPPVTPNQRVTQALARGSKRFASVMGRNSGWIAWNLGGGWISSAPDPPGPYGSVLLATTDLDHDGHLEMVAYQIWANDYGIQMFVETATAPIYQFSCGNR